VGNEAKQSFSLRLRPKRWRHDKMNLSEGFLSQVSAKFPEGQQDDLLKTFLEVNRKKRQDNHDKVRQVCATSQPRPLWSGAFQRFQGKSMARFGDRRTYIWQKRPVDEQVHQGEDLASLIQSPIPAANNGVVVLAAPLGIYGNTVIVDHGMGVFSMYSHLSKIDVKAGERVEKGKTLGLTGTTGLAGGDHLHFSVMIHGDFVNPVEWWDAHWLKDQVEKVWVQGPTPKVATGQPVKSQAALKKTKTSKGRKRKR
jgi:murein DD-endopeptidase MepM/ murein hydrolase activator NlpD